MLAQAVKVQLRSTGQGGTVLLLSVLKGLQKPRGEECCPCPKRANNLSRKTVPTQERGSPEFLPSLRILSLNNFQDHLWPHGGKCTNAGITHLAEMHHSVTLGDHWGCCVCRGAVRVRSGSNVSLCEQHEAACVHNGVTLPSGPRTALTPSDIPQHFVSVFCKPCSFLCSISNSYICLLLTRRARA